MFIFSTGCRCGEKQKLKRHNLHRLCYALPQKHSPARTHFPAYTVDLQVVLSVTNGVVCFADMLLPCSAGKSRTSPIRADNDFTPRACACVRMCVFTRVCAFVLASVYMCTYTCVWILILRLVSQQKSIRFFTSSNVRNLISDIVYEI